MAFKVFVVAYGGKDGVEEAFPRLEKSISSAGGAKIIGIDTECTGDLSGIDADLVVVLGGDGTIIGTARRLGENQVPTLGINVGRLGFLSAFTNGDMERAIELALKGKLREEPRLMIKAYVFHEGSTVPFWESLALNDTVLGRPRAGALMAVDVKVGGTFVSTYAGDGVIVSTPGGSTAYSLSAGGPIIVPGMDALVVVPLACHSLSLRPLVVHPGDGVELFFREDSKAASAFLVSDGQVSTEVKPGDIVRIRPAEKKFRLLNDPEWGFFDLLREKLGWAGHPRYKW